MIWMVGYEKSNSEILLFYAERELKSIHCRTAFHVIFGYYMQLLFSIICNTVENWLRTYVSMKHSGRHAIMNTRNICIMYF